jgi:hypothetical protein
LLLNLLLCILTSFLYQCELLDALYVLVECRNTVVVTASLFKYKVQKLKDYKRASCALPYWLNNLHKSCIHVRILRILGNLLTIYIVMIVTPEHLPIHIHLQANIYITWLHVYSICMHIIANYNFFRTPAMIIILYCLRIFYCKQYILYSFSCCLSITITILIYSFFSVFTITLFLSVSFIYINFFSKKYKVNILILFSIFL